LDTTGTITNFTSTVNNLFDIGGDAYRVETAGKSYSLTNPDSQTLRFEIRPGDYTWFDSAGTVDRANIDGSAQYIQPGTPVNIGYQFMVEANGPNGSFTNTANWFTTGEMHNNDLVRGVHTSPPFAIQLSGDHLQVVARYCLPGGNPSNSSSDLHMMTLWTDPNPIKTGQFNDIQIQANFSNTSSGYLQVSINGTQVVNYHGPLGYGDPTYWMEGLYRNAGPTETVAAEYRDTTLTTGSAATTPTTPTIQPAVTQATATPGTGIEHAGDVITLTLAFNEAVTVTGTPTLSLNDGGKATYVSGSGSGTLTFKTTVASTDTSTSALAITGVNLPSGTAIKDASGNAANLSGAVKTFTGLQIDPILPAVTQATAVPGTGTEHVGDTITLTLAFNEAVTVTGTPTLSLNDGGKATYFGGSGTGTLTFKTTVASTDTSTSALAITGVNLPSGASIKDASGVAANLSAAVKTFSGLAVSTASTTPTDPTAPTTPTTPTAPTPSATKPVLTVADHSLWVAGRGGSVDLGTTVTTTDSNDVVTLNITGLPKYETITDKLDGQTFRGNNITLTAAQVDSGLVLHSYYRGGGHPTATLTLTASAKDPTTGAVATASPQSITVVDPRPTTTTTTTTSSHHHHTATNQQPVATTTAAAPTTSHTTESTDHQHTAAASTGSLASQGFARLQQHFDPAASTLATTAAHPIMAADHPAATGTTMASFASQSFALLNQYLAAHTGRVDPGQFVTALSQATGWGHDSLLARPQH